MGGRHAAIERHNHEDIDAWQQASTTANRDTDDSSNTVAAHVPVTLADGLATALFTTPATQLRAHFPFECAILNANRTAAQSPNFPGGFFTH